MPIIWLGGLAIAGVSLFLGSQLDDAIDKPTQVVGGGTNTQMPVEYRLIIAVAGATGAYFLVKKLAKKL